MFLDTEKVLMDQTLNIENDSIGISITDSCPGCGPPHIAHPIAKISKVKDQALITIFSNRFATLFFNYNRFMRCLSSVVNPVAVAVL